jgi:hypothetical protein
MAMAIAEVPSQTAGYPITEVAACSRDSGGVLFVVHGDMSTLHSDAVLIPSDSAGGVRETWSWVWEPGTTARHRQLSEHVAALQDRHTPVFSLGEEDRIRTVVVGNIAAPKGSAADADFALEWLTAGFRDCLDSYGSWLFENPPLAENRRAVPLLSMPLIGTKGAGLARIRGRVIDAILGVIREYQESAHEGQAQFDVVLVCNEAADYAAVQSRRRLGDPVAMPEWLVPVERSAQAGQLGVMFGAGASISLGMPAWGELLGKIVKALGSTTLTADDLAELDPVDAASLLVDLADRAADGDREQGAALFGQCLSKFVTTDECSLIHALVANLRPAVAITTNYDRGYENAVLAMGGGSPAVLPWQQPESADQPRLLKLHGDVHFGSVVLSRQHFVAMQAHRRPLGGLLQERMMVGHLLTVGSTMSDPTLVLAAEEVASLLQETTGKVGRHGTVVLTEDHPARRSLLHRSFDVVVADVDDDGKVDRATAARRVEILLDLLAMRATRGLSFLLDDAYSDLVDADQRTTVDLLRSLRDHVLGRSGALDLAVENALSRLGRQ